MRIRKQQLLPSFQKLISYLCAMVMLSVVLPRNLKPFPQSAATFVSIEALIYVSAHRFTASAVLLAYFVILCVSIFVMRRMHRKNYMPVETTTSYFRYVDGVLPFV